MIAVRKELVDRLSKGWNFTESQLSDLSIYHLVNILMLLAGPYGYIGQFAPTIWALRETLDEAEVYDKPSELRMKADHGTKNVTKPVESDAAESTNAAKKVVH